MTKTIEIQVKTWTPIFTIKSICLIKSIIEHNETFENRSDTEVTVKKVTRVYAQYTQ